MTNKRAKVIAVNFSANMGVDIAGPKNISMDLKKLLLEFEGLSSDLVGLPPDRSHDHHIPLKPGCSPINVRPYRYPYYMKGEIGKLIFELLQVGVVWTSTSPYSSPMLMVKKKDGSWCLYLNYRALNQITVKDKFPILVIDELLDELNGARYFSKLDLRSGYHQIKM